MNYENYFKENNFTLMLVKGKEIRTFDKKGVAPLIDLYYEGCDLSDYVVYDKVIGKGAAFLYVLLNAKKIHTGVISAPALNVLADIAVSYEVLCDNIINQSKIDICPIEKAVLDIDEATMALPIIIKTLENLVKNTRKL